ncbi:MAG: hypothetical protein ACQES9_07925 [Myxococcota bacterium]
MKKSILLAILMGIMFSAASTGCFWRSRRSRSRCYRTKSGRRVCKSKSSRRRGRIGRKRRKRRRRHR